jgi:hypothetical protein
MVVWVGDATSPIVAANDESTTRSPKAAGGPALVEFDPFRGSLQAVLKRAACGAGIVPCRSGHATKSGRLQPSTRLCLVDLAVDAFIARRVLTISGSGR